jgi:hypothetical protein
LILVGLIGLIVLGVVIWLIVRPEPSARSQHTPGRDARPTEVPEQEASSEDGFEVGEAEGGPHPRPPELDRESRRELRLLDERLHRAFFDQSQMSPDKWAQIADHLLIVHDRMPVGILVERFEQITDTQVRAPSQTEKSPREVAALLNGQLSRERRLERLGTLEEPVDADVYGPDG